MSLIRLNENNHRSFRLMAIRCVVLLASLSVGVIACEILVRLLAPEYMGLHLHPSSIIRDDFLTHDRLGQYDRLLGWKLRPNATELHRELEFSHVIRTNSRGYRDDEIELERRPGTRRILVLGDSFGMGWGVRRGEIFADLLEERLNNTEVVNLSVAGYSTDQELLVYKTEGVLYNADIVLLALLLENDISGNLHPNYHGINKPYFRMNGHEMMLTGVPVPYVMRRSEKIPITPGRAFPVHDWLDAHSGLYALLFHRLTSVDWLRHRWLESGLLHDQVPIFTPDSVNLLLKTPAVEFKAGLTLIGHLLARWRDLVCGHGSLPIVVIIPSHLQVYPEIWQEIINDYGLDPNMFDLSAPNRQMVDLCHSLGIPALDLLPTMREYAPTSLPLHYKTNPHWTAEGHRVAAGAIREYLDIRYFQPGQQHHACP